MQALMDLESARHTAADATSESERLRVELISTQRRQQQQQRAAIAAQTALRARLERAGDEGAVRAMEEATRGTCELELVRAAASSDRDEMLMATRFEVRSLSCIIWCLHLFTPLVNIAGLQAAAQLQAMQTKCSTIIAETRATARERSVRQADRLQVVIASEEV